MAAKQTQEQPPKQAVKPPQRSSRSESKPQASKQDSPREVQAEAVTFPTDPDLDKLEAERAELQQPGRASRNDGEQLDNSPGYDKDQLAHMREYWGLKESTAEVADV